MLLFRLLLLFTLVPFIEFVLLLWISRQTGLITAIVIVLGTGLIGAALARRQGLETLRRIQAEMSDGHVPGSMLLDGLMILIAGVLLIAPGVLTDLLGLSLLVPAVRERLKRRMIRWFREHTVVQLGPGGRESPLAPEEDVIIDADFTRYPREG
jgi:UPF0716 protein FxsA